MTRCPPGFSRTFPPGLVTLQNWSSSPSPAASAAASRGPHQRCVTKVPVHGLQTERNGRDASMRQNIPGILNIIGLAACQNRLQSAHAHIQWMLRIPFGEAKAWDKPVGPGASGLTRPIHCPHLVPLLRLLQRPCGARVQLVPLQLLGRFQLRKPMVEALLCKVQACLSGGRREGVGDLGCLLRGFGEGEKNG